MSYDINKFIDDSYNELLNEAEYLLEFLKDVELHINSNLPFKTNLFDGIINDIQESINNHG